MKSFKNWLRKEILAFLQIEAIHSGLIVKSEADINKIANELYKLQYTAIKGRGIN